MADTLFAEYMSQHNEDFYVLEEVVKIYLKIYVSKAQVNPFDQHIVFSLVLTAVLLRFCRRKHRRISQSSCTCQA
jgi:hypothetical protein